MLFFFRPVGCRVAAYLCLAKRGYGLHGLEVRLRPVSVNTHTHTLLCRVRVMTSSMPRTCCTSTSHGTQRRLSASAASWRCRWPRQQSGSPRQCRPSRQPQPTVSRVQCSGSWRTALLDLAWSLVCHAVNYRLQCWFAGSTLSVAMLPRRADEENTHSSHQTMSDQVLPTLGSC